MATATATVTVDHLHLHLESIPIVDLRLLSQPELLSLSACTSSPSPSNAETELFTPKIDRSVFNESAGSRKQTFFRLRFAAPRSHLQHQHSSASSEPFPPPPLLNLNPESLDEESSNTLSLFKSLFNIDESLSANPESDEPYDDKDLVPVQFEYPIDNSTLHNIPVGIVSSSSVGKRKRGRPRKDGRDNWLIESEPLPVEEYKETETSDKPNETPDAGNSSSCNRVKRRRGRPRKEESQSRMIGSEQKKFESAIERASLGKVEEILGIEEELRRRTEGIVSEAQLMEFMGGLEGQWVTKNQKKRIVDAAGFGNVLPQGWKLMLFVKRRGSHFWLACSRYIRPNGQQFVSCKEVSSYLLGFGGLKDSGLETSNFADKDIDFALKPSSGNLPITYRSSELEKQTPMQRMGSPKEVQRAEIINCHKCTMTFNLKDDFIYHLLSSHKGSAMSSGHGTSTNEEVKNKDGKYECQFCHELFEERNCYRSHLGVHIENNMRKVEGSVGEQNSIQPLNSAGNNGIGPGIRSSESNENHLVQMLTDNNHECNLLSHDEQDKVNRNEKVLAEKNCDKQSKFYSAADNKGDFNAADVATDLNVCLGSENVLSTADKEGISQPSCKIDAGFALPVEDKKREFASSTSFLAPNVKGNMFTDENIVDRHFPSFLNGIEADLKDKATRDDRKAGCADTSIGLDNVRIDAKQENYSEGYSLIPPGNKQRVNLVDHLKGASVTIDSAHERGFGCGLTSSKDDQTCAINNNSTLVSGRLDFPESIMVNESANIDPTVCFQSHLPMKKPSREKSETFLHASHGREQIFPSDNNAFKVFSRTVEMSELDEAQNSRGMIQGVNRHDSGVDANILDSVKHGKTKDHQFGPSSYKKTSTCTPEYKQDKGSERILYQQYANQQNSNYDNSMNKVSFFNMEEPKHKGGSSFAGNAYARPGPFALTGTVQGSCSPHFSGNREKIVGKNNIPGISSGAVHEPKQNKGAFENFFGLSCSEQKHVANNLNMVHAGTAHNGSRLQGFENARNNEIMTGYSNHAQPIEDSMTGLTWKSNEGNVLLSGLTDTSSQLLPSSGYYPTFDWMSHKGESEMFDISGKCNSVSGFEGLQSDSIEHMEYNFLTAQPSSCSGNSKIGSEMFNISGKCSNEPGFGGLRSDNLEHMEYSFMTAQPSSNSVNSKVPSYDSEMALKFDSSVWHGNDVLPLLPKVAGRHQVTLCHWCGNEFYNQAVDIGAQRSTTLLCANCQARFSRNRDFI